jgi:hypothetical protein
MLHADTQNAKRITKRTPLFKKQEEEMTDHLNKRNSYGSGMVCSNRTDRQTVSALLTHARPWAAAKIVQIRYE